jgi:AcrR family transcriptional regulator
MARININAIRRRQIIDAAVEVMARKGWSETSIDEITKEAGVSRGLVSYHFKDKADLLAGVLDRCRELYNEAVTSAVAETDDRLERMRLTIRKAIGQIRDDPVTYEVFLHFAAGARSHPELGEQLRSLWSGFREGTARAIRAGQSHGYYRRDIDADAAAANVVGTIVGLALQWLIDPGGYPLEPAARDVEEMLMAYLTAGAPGEGAALDNGQSAASDVYSPAPTGS